MINKYTVIDLFSGAGGLSQGFVQAGYELLVDIDFDKVALQTYAYNIKGAKVLEEDLFNEEIAIKNIEKAISNSEVDVIIAGPPCQGFSLTGSRDINDSRNKLYLAVVHAIQHFKPKAFMIENVPGMATLYKGTVKQQILNTLEDMNYAVTVTDSPLLAADYGVPQFRKRMFFVGYSRNLGYDYFTFPEPLLDEEHYIGTADAISDLPSLVGDLGDDVMDYINGPQSEYQKLMRIDSDVIFNHVGTNHSKEVKWVINQVPEGGNHKDLPPGVGESRRFNEAWTRYHSKRPSKTIDTGHRNHFHYKWNRVPTVRENARLQSFPDRFKFLGTKTQQYKQVGNAVPPLLAQAIGLKMKEHLDSITNISKGVSNEEVKQY